MTDNSYSRIELGQMESLMESYKVLYFKDGDQGDTRLKLYYCNMHESYARSWLYATGIQIKWRQK